MSADSYAKFSVSMPAPLKQKVEQRVTHTSFAETRSAVVARDLKRLYDGLLKQGLKTLRNANLSSEERACVGTLLGRTAFTEPSHISLLVVSLVEDATHEMHSLGVDSNVLLAKLRKLDTAALYALVDLIERDPGMSEIA